MVQIKNSYQIKKITEASAILSEVMSVLISYVDVGVTPLDLDARARKEIQMRGASPSFLGYRGFPAALCVSVDDVVIHGIPTATPLADGQIVGIDCGIRMDKYYSDSARTVAVGTAAPAHLQLIDAAERALYAGISTLTPGNSIREYARRVQDVARTHDLGIIKEYCGHGVGLAIHEEPSIPNFFSHDAHERVAPGMILALEPMYSARDPAVYVGADGWSVRSKDKSMTTHCEHTVLITDGEPKILTRWE